MNSGGSTVFGNDRVDQSCWYYYKEMCSQPLGCKACSSISILHSIASLLRTIVAETPLFLPQIHNKVQLLQVLDFPDFPGKILRRMSSFTYSQEDNIFTFSKNGQVYFKLLILPGRQGISILCGNVSYFAGRKKAIPNKYF